MRAQVPCVVLGAGLGKRLQPLTTHLPKPLAPVANRPVLEHILRGVATAGFTDVYINLHHRPEDIIRYLLDSPVPNLRLTWRVEEELSGPAGALLAFEDVLSTHKAILVISGDALHTFDLARFVDQHLASHCRLSVIVKEVSHPGRYGVAELNAKSQIVRFVEKPPLPEHAQAWVSCGVYCLDPVLLSRIPPHRVYDFGADLIPALAQAGETVLGFKSDAYWCDIGDLRMLKQANLDVVSGKVNTAPPGNEVWANVWAEPNATIAASAEIVGPVLIGEGAHLGDRTRVIGPSVIGPRCVLGTGSWLVRSVLLPDSRLTEGAMLSDGMLGQFDISAS